MYYSILSARYNTGTIGNWNFPGKEGYLQSRENHRQTHKNQRPDE